jgi:hypothetical protein
MNINRCEHNGNPPFSESDDPGFRWLCPHSLRAPSVSRSTRSFWSVIIQPGHFPAGCTSALPPVSRPEVRWRSAPLETCRDKFQLLIDLCRGPAAGRAFSTVGI